MGVVYRAQDLKHQRPVAIKVLLPHVAVTLGADRFLREIAIAARLQHPHILGLFDSGQVDEFLYYVMSLADGGTLRERLERERPLAIAEALRITRDVGDALAHAHRAGIVHRDVKPGNILFTAGHAAVGDFGIAHAIAGFGFEQLTSSGITVGTPAYMSPEQAAGEAKIDARADIYGLACVLFEMLAGDPPFTGANPRVVLARQLTERVPSVAVARPEVPPAVAAALGRALSKVPADRPASIEEFLTDLQSASEARPRARRVPGWAQAAIASTLVLGAGTGWWLSTGHAAPLSADKIAIFPLAARSVAAGNVLDGAGVAYLIEAALEQADPLRLIDVRGRLDERQQADPQLISAAAARRVARELGAGYYLSGVIQGHTDSTTVMLTLHDTRGDSVVARKSVTGDLDVPLHHLGIDALLELLPALIDPGVDMDLSALRDRKAAAIALWWQGERAYRASNFAAALDLYSRALAEDSALAIAAVKGAQAASWSHDKVRGAAMIERAIARESLLPHRYAVLARGLRNYFAGAADSAVYWFREANRLYPEWWEPTVALAEVHYHLFPTVDAALDSVARSAFERGLGPDSASPALFHLIELRLRDGELGEADRLLARFRTPHPDPVLVEQLELMRRCVAGPRTMDWSHVADASPLAALMAGKSLAAAGRQPECAEGAFRAVLQRSDIGKSDGWGAFVGLQAVLIATGRDRQALALIDTVAARKGTARSLYVLGVAAGARMEHAAGQLESFARARFGEDYSGVVNAESLWVLSLWLEHEGDTARFEAARRQLAGRAARDSATERERRFAFAASARAALHTDTARALAMLSALPAPEPDSIAWGFGAALAPERLALARLLLARGHYREAIRAAAVFDHAEPIMFLEYLPLSLAIRHQAALALRDRSGAATYQLRLERLHRLELIARPPQYRR